MEKKEAGGFYFLVLTFFSFFVLQPIKQWTQSKWGCSATTLSVFY